MFPDARAAPVHKDGSFTLVSSGLKDHLQDKQLRHHENNAV